MKHFKFVDNTQTDPAEEQLKFEEKLKKQSEEMGCSSVGVSAEEGWLEQAAVQMQDRE